VLTLTTRLRRDIRRRLSDATGVPLRRRPWPEDHELWVVYRAAAEDRDLWPLLRSAVMLERDHDESLANAVVIAGLVASRDDEDRAWWLAAARPDWDAHAAAEEMAIIREVAAGRAVSPSDLDEWPDRLQRHVVEVAPDAVVALLAEHARARRVRARAAERLGRDRLLAGER
jgi:hypothetical protein